MPLNSYRVLDLTRLLPGPYCTLLLADYGAEVIKVEDMKTGDYARWEEPKIDENSAFFHSLNRNKKSISIDLKADQGKEVFLKLVKEADVVVESFRPGVMDRLGIGYDVLASVNPALVYCAITGYGQTGPYKDLPGHDINYLSYSGLLHFFGRPNTKPTVPPAQIADLGGGALPAAFGIMMALLEREKSGKGQFIDISMLDNVISWMQTILPDYLTTNVEPRPGELTLSGGKACYEVYETKDKRYLSVGALEPKFWEAFCKGIGKEEFIPLLDAPLFKQHQLKADIQTIISEKPLEAWLTIFSDMDTCVAPVLTLEEMKHNPQLAYREMVQTENHPHISPPIKMSKTPGTYKQKAPRLGEHAEELLAEINISSDEYKRLKENGVML
ncbi:CaiB/BaiF CoA transferase family protein [Alteribacillus bidgolensis]|uniref:Crotonobetainyl-CoA:carnitine CoA-transferase CaiB n=1 Tax=Alteribacillus bidgolensis TaxID=930129 RepID=A0A1G8D0S0_9BACI|nr:CaiB/BaiF CoA-transferase family protein [Alteribacillus bidgolensis]SDH51355.1 Crotonobetainyl-CoA:carnitine CoA-transferase CaiB [Alteribacillus bidgolensis]